MPEYVYRSEDGEEVTRVCPMSKAPRIGAKIRRNGKTFSRVAMLGPGPGICIQTEHKAYSLPRLWQDPAMGKIHNNFDERGVACFGSKREIDEFQAKTKHRNGYASSYRYNEDSD